VTDRFVDVGVGREIVERRCCGHRGETTTGDPIDPDAVDVGGTVEHGRERLGCGDDVLTPSVVAVLGPNERRHDLHGTPGHRARASQHCSRRASNG
jgi:hypothetical protein